MPTSIFQVPARGHDFHTRVVSRSLALIDRDIWSGLTALRLKRWMRNFGTEEERYFAACVLDSLIYRSDRQTEALVVHLFQRSLVDTTRRQPTVFGTIEDWLSRLRMMTCNIRLVTAVKGTDSTHKSAHLVSRLMKRQLGIRQEWIAKPWELAAHAADGASVFVFIDDFLGTGRQFEELLVDEDLNWLFKAGTVIYAPFVAHTSGISYLARHFPQLIVSAAELLDERSSLFHQEHPAFDDGLNTSEGARDFYYDFLTQKGLRYRGDDRLGFGGLGLAYAFEHAVPDNNLPLLWAPQNASWYPLFDR